LLRWEVLVPVAASKNGSAEPQNYNSGPFSAATATGPRKVNGTGSGANFPRAAGSTPARPASFLVSRRRPHPCRGGARAATRAASRRERRSYRTLFPGDVEVGDGAFEDLGAQADRLRDGRVRVDGVADVGRLRAHLDRQRDLGDELAGMHADDAAADDAAGIRIEQQLGEALGAAQADGAAGSGPRELRHLDRDALGPGLGLGDPDPGDLRVGVGHRRDHPRHPLALVPAATSAATWPSWVALCASIGWPTRSPIAKMCGTLVRICASTAMKPRSDTCTPALPASSLPPLGARPTATSTRS